MAGIGDYAERATLASDPTFINRVSIAVMKKALAVQVETGTGSKHDKRVALATSVIEASGQVDWQAHRYPVVMRRFAAAVASSFTVPGQNPQNENDMDTVLTQVWDGMALVNSADA